MSKGDASASAPARAASPSGLSPASGSSRSGIAIAAALLLAACAKAPQTFEEQPLRGEQMDRFRAFTADTGPTGSLARVALADGKVTGAELSQVQIEQDHLMSEQPELSQ